MQPSSNFSEAVIQLKSPSHTRARMWSHFLHEQLRTFWLAAAALGAIYAVDSRFAMNPNRISYLNSAHSIIQHDWRKALNAHWSPLYPLLLAIFLQILGPSPGWESTVVHLLNYGIYLATLTAFTCFLKRSIQQKPIAPQAIVWPPESAILPPGGLPSLN